MRSLRPLLAGLTLALASCSALSTSFDYDTAADFGRLKSYAWIEDQGDSESNSLALQRARAAVDEVLSARGYRLDQQAPDFLVSAHVTAKERVQVSDWGYTYGGPYGAWYGTRDLDVYTYDEGSLILDVVDASSRSLVWRGTASRAVESSWTPEKREQVVREAVEALLERFPPAGKG